MSAVLQLQAKQVFRWVTFQPADEVYGSNVMQVREGLRMTEIAPVPCCWLAPMARFSNQNFDAGFNLAALPQ